jgi:hypothetical protein
MSTPDTSRWMRLGLPKRGPLRIAALAGIVVAFVLVTTGVLALLFPSRAAASSSSLAILDGVVALSHNGASFTQGRDGDLVQQGDVIRTGADSHVVLTFFDGSTIEVEPNSELIVDTLQANASGDILMTMVQTVGRSWHVVARALSSNSKYEVRTPTTTASVRGTAFQVNVTPTGLTNLQTTEGKVHAVTANADVEVAPGFQTNIAPGGAPPDPVTPAPEPTSVVKIVVDATPNAAVTDANGRTVGVLNGLPVRYAPGSTVQNIDGKLVITIPNIGTGKLDTHVQPAKAGDTSVDVNVQVIVGGATVGNVTEHRTIDATGIAKGGVVVTNTGTFVLPDGTAKNSVDPKIGKVPTAPTGGFTPFGGAMPGPTSIVTPDPSFVPRFSFDPRVATGSVLPAIPSPTTIATFDGGFQPFVVATSGAATTNANVILFTATTVPTELAKLALTTPTPAATLDARLTAPVIIQTIGATGTGLQVVPGLVVPSTAASAVPSFVILQSFNPGVLPSFGPAGPSLPSFSFPPLPSFTPPSFTPPPFPSGSFVPPSFVPSFSLPPLPPSFAPPSFAPPPSLAPPPSFTPPVPPSGSLPPFPSGSVPPLPTGSFPIPSGGSFAPPPSGALPSGGAFPTPPPGTTFAPPPSGGSTPPPGGFVPPPPPSGGFVPPPPPPGGLVPPPPPPGGLVPPPPPGG